MAGRNVLLGALEAEVMEIAWTDHEVTVHDVSARLRNPRSYTTVQTTPERLHHKGLLIRRKESHAFAYSPRFDRTGYASLLMESVLPRPTDEAVMSAFNSVPVIAPCEWPKKRMRSAAVVASARQTALRPRLQTRDLG